jgi:hypothetical protein
VLSREEREPMIAAKQCHLLAFDNLSGLPAWLSDALCAVRQKRATLLNGIEHIGRPDLADRAIFLSLGPIGEEQRRSATELWREFELARLHTVCGLWFRSRCSAAADGRFRALGYGLCETRLWPAGTFTRAYAGSRKAAIEGVIEADPVASWVREIMSERSSWTGSAADPLRVSLERTSQTSDRAGQPKTPRALAGHLRRAQTFLRALGIDIAFSRQDRASSRVIRMRTPLENTVSTVSSVRDRGPNPVREQHSPDPPSAVCNDRQSIWLAPDPQVPGTVADDADGTDAKAASHRHQP